MKATIYYKEFKYGEYVDRVITIDNVPENGIEDWFSNWVKTMNINGIINQIKID